MTIKKVLVVLVLLMGLLIVIPLLINHFGYGQLDITTNSHLNSITLTQSITSKNSGGTVLSKQAYGSLSIKLKKGEYLISIQNGSNSSSQSIVVKAHSKEHIVMNLVSAGGVEPVISDFASDMVADSSHLVYLSSDDSSINEINTQNQDIEIDSNYDLRSISWADTSFGVGQNASGNLFVIQNGTVSPLNSPVSNSDNSDVVFVVAPNREIYVAFGSSVYSGTASGGFKKIYTKRQVGSVLSAGLGRVSLIDSGYSGSQANIVTIDSSGKSIERQQSTFINTWSSWSPHDKYIVINGASTGEVLNSSMQQVATIPQGDFTNPVWLNDNTLFYNINDQLWSYNIQTQRAQVISNMPNGEQIQQIVVSTDGAYIYLVTTDTAGTPTIRRVGLHDQQVPNIVYQLQEFLLTPPTPGSGYAIGLINFSGEPTVQVVLSDGSNATNSLQSTMQTLQQDGFNLSQLQFSVVQGD